MPLSEVPLQLWARIGAVMFMGVVILSASIAAIIGWLDKREQKRREAGEMKERMTFLEKDNRDLRESLKEKNDEICEHLEENANLSTERDALQMRVDDLERQVGSVQAELNLYRKTGASKRDRVAQKLSDVLHLVKSEY
jgi:cell division protein FtsB